MATRLGELDIRILSPILKATMQPDGSLLVEGIATSEALDSQGEIVDYDAAKGAFSTWRGNVREQHDPSKAIGRGLDVLPDDTARHVYLKAFVSKGAPDTQAKVLDGTLSYFSIGGRAKARKKEKTEKGTATRIFLDRLSEVSLVDSGANPDSAITVVKADGEVLLAVDLEDDSEKGDTMTRDDVLKVFGQEIRDARQAIEILDAVALLYAFEMGEQHAEDPAQMAALQQAIDGLKAFITLELAEAEPPEGEAAPVEMTEPEPEVQKEDEVEKARDWQAEHDLSVENGAKCSTGKVEKIDEPAASPAAADTSEVVAKLADLAGTLDTLKADLSVVREENATLKAQVERYGERVVEPGRPVTKEAASALLMAPAGSTEPGALPISTDELIEIVKRAHGDKALIERDVRFAVAKAQAVSALANRR